MMDNVYVAPGGNRPGWDFGPGFSNELHYHAINDAAKGHRGRFSIFSRGQFLEYLMFLYHETGDEKVIEKYREVLSFFFRTYPIVVEEFSADAGHLMYTEDRDVMNLGWLLFVLTEMLYTRMTYDAGYETAFEIIKHLWFGAMQFRRFDDDVYRPYNHHYFERGITPLFLSIMYPEFPEISCMGEKAASFCVRHIQEDFNEDGGYSELSIAYWFGAAVAEMLYRNIAIARLNGYPLLDEKTQNQVNRTFDVLYNLVINGTHLPSIGDNLGPMIDPMLNLAHLATGDEKFRELLDYRNGRGGYPSTVTKYYANDKVGLVIGKSGVEPDANGFYMSAKVNCGISGHNHMDMLSMIIKLRGEYFVNEAYSGKLYHLHTHKSHLRGWCYNMDSHNSVLCYGEPIQSWEKYANRFGVYRPDSPITAFNDYGNGMYVSAYHYGYTFCSHERRVLFADNGNMVVRDLVNRGNRLDNAHIQRWNLEPGVKPTVLGDHAILLEKGNLRYLWLFDAPYEFRIYRNTELLSEFFEDNEIGYVLDVHFKPLGNVHEHTMLVKLTTLMLDVTDRDIEMTDDLIAKVKSIGDRISEKETLDELYGDFR